MIEVAHQRGYHLVVLDKGALLVQKLLTIIVVQIWIGDRAIGRNAHQRKVSAKDSVIMIRARFFCGCFQMLVVTVLIRFDFLSEHSANQEQRYRGKSIQFVFHRAVITLVDLIALFNNIDIVHAT